MNNNHKDQTNKCHECDAKFTDKTLLQTHMNNIHIESRPEKP